MKKQYEEILNTTTGGYRFEVKRNSSKFVVKVAKAGMKNFDNFENGQIDGKIRASIPTSLVPPP